MKRIPTKQEIELLLAEKKRRNRELLISYISDVVTVAVVTGTVYALVRWLL